MEKKTTGLSIMLRLIKLVAPLKWIMTLGIVLGTIGHLCAIAVTVIGAKGVTMMLMGQGNYQKLILVLVVVAILRGIFHYGEQYCNHYIAFTILAIIRNKVFAALRKLCPAKLEGKDKGNLITMITTDIELLEVFFAHTISPIAIAVLVSVIMLVFFANISIVSALIGLLGYVAVGIIIPIYNGRRSASTGADFRNEVGSLNSYVLDLAYGIDESIQYDSFEQNSNGIDTKSKDLGNTQNRLVGYEKNQRTATNVVIQTVSVIMLIAMSMQYMNGRISFESVVLAVVAIMSSFGPVIALASLSNNLNQTLACGKRVLDLLDEEPEAEDVTDGIDLEMDNSIIEDYLVAEDITFSYKDKLVFENKTVKLPKEKIVGIHGPSGCGKSTFIRLLMRFWKINSGQILYDINGDMVDVNQINTSSLRHNQSFVTQETWIAHDTILNNIKIAKEDATFDEVREAASKASILEFIESLPEGFETVVGEQGSTLSSGEKQRIGLARAFLHDGKMLILDEPTSALDALNEAVILKSIKNASVDKNIILVSHRKSTMKVADAVIEF